MIFHQISWGIKRWKLKGLQRKITGKNYKFWRIIFSLPFLGRRKGQVTEAFSEWLRASNFDCLAYMKSKDRCQNNARSPRQKAEARNYRVKPYTGNKWQFMVGQGFVSVLLVRYGPWWEGNWPSAPMQWNLPRQFPKCMTELEVRISIGWAVGYIEVKTQIMRITIREPSKSISVEGTKAPERKESASETCHGQRAPVPEFHPHAETTTVHDHYRLVLPVLELPVDGYI